MADAFHYPPEVFNLLVDTRYDKLDVMFAGFVTIALIAEALRLCYRP